MDSASAVPAHDVFDAGDWLQMANVHAGTNTTEMVDVQSGRDRTIRRLPRDAMTTLASLPSISVAIDPPRPDDAVPLRVTHWPLAIGGVREAGEFVVSSEHPLRGSDVLRLHEVRPSDDLAPRRRQPLHVERRFGDSGERHASHID